MRTLSICIMSSDKPMASANNSESGGDEYRLRVTSNGKLIPDQIAAPPCRAIGTPHSQPLRLTARCVITATQPIPFG